MILGDISTYGSGGGGNGKMIQQLKLPLSMVYDEFTSAKAWGSTSVSKLYDGKGVDLCADGCLYSMTPGQALYTLNCTTNEFTSAQYSGISGRFFGLFKYNSEIYIMTLNTVQNVRMAEQYFYAYKLNQTTKTVTMIKTFMSGAFTNYEEAMSSASSKCYDYNLYSLDTVLLISDKCFGLHYVAEQYTFTSSSSYNTYTSTISHFFIYNAFTNEFTTPYKVQSPAHNWSVSITQPQIRLVQRKGNKVRLVLTDGKVWNAVATPTLVMYEINLDPTPVAVSQVGIPANILTLINNEKQKIDSVQVGDKVMYLSSVPMSGKFTGEIDLFEMTYNSLKYPDIPTDAPKMDAANYNLHFVNDQVRSITLTGSDVYTWSSKIFSLDLTPKPPQLNPLAVKIFKGEKYNILSGMDLDILGLSSPAQPSFTLTGQQQIAPQDLEIHLGQYQLSGMPVDVVIEKG